MKMANMDSAFDFMFTSPKDATGVSSLVVFFNNYLEIFETPSEKKIVKPYSRFCLNLS